MPTYEYECKSCGHGFEVFQSMSEEPLKKCPQCGKAVRRLIHGGTGVIFKGSGFYVTDKGKAASGAKASGPAVPAGNGSGAEKPAVSPKTESSGGKNAGGESASGGNPAKKTEEKPSAKTA